MRARSIAVSFFPFLSFHFLKSCNNRTALGHALCFLFSSSGLDRLGNDSAGRKKAPPERSSSPCGQERQSRRRREGRGRAPRPSAEKAPPSRPCRPRRHRGAQRRRRQVEKKKSATRQDKKRRTSEAVNEDHHANFIAAGSGTVLCGMGFNCRR